MKISKVVKTAVKLAPIVIPIVKKSNCYEERSPLFFQRQL